MNSKSIHTHMRHEMCDKKLFEQAKAYAFDCMDTIAARTVYPDARAIANLARFDEPMPENPHTGEDVLHLLHAYGSPATVAQTGGRYFGFVNGNVNTGAFDGFDAICEEARQAGAWVHVDGAFGLWAAASEKRQYLTRGIEKADSWSVDGHKTLNTPYDCGIILCRHREALIEARQASGAYIQYSDPRDGMLYGPDMSRRARAVEVWAALKYLGRNGVAQLIDGFCENAAYFAEALKENGFRVLNDVVFNQMLVACQTPTETQRTL